MKHRHVPSSPSLCLQAHKQSPALLLGISGLPHHLAIAQASDNDFGFCLLKRNHITGSYGSCQHLLKSVTSCCQAVTLVGTVLRYLGRGEFQPSISGIKQLTSLIQHIGYCAQVELCIASHFILWSCDSQSSRCTYLEVQSWQLRFFHDSTSRHKTSHFLVTQTGSDVVDLFSYSSGLILKCKVYS